MKQQAVVIKSNRYGITLFLNRDLPFQELLEAIGEKFRTPSDFFKMPEWHLRWKAGS